MEYWWESLPTDSHKYSEQVFDREAEKSMKRA